MSGRAPVEAGRRANAATRSSAGAPTAMTAVLAVAVGPASGRTLTVAAVARTPGAAAASMPARRHSATVAAAVSCGSTRPNASCTAAAVAHQASNSGPLGALPVRVANTSAKCGTLGKAGSRTALPPASMAPRANNGSAPAAASAVNCSVTPRPHSSTASTAPCAKALCAAPGSARPNTGSMRAPSRWTPSNAARSKLRWTGGGDTGAAVRCQYAVGRPTDDPGAGAGHHRHPVADVELRAGVAHHPGERRLARYQQHGPARPALHAPRTGWRR